MKVAELLRESFVKQLAGTKKPAKADDLRSFAQAALDGHGAIEHDDKLYKLDNTSRESVHRKDGYVSEYTMNYHADWSRTKPGGDAQVVFIIDDKKAKLVRVAVGKKVERFDFDHDDKLEANVRRLKNLARKNPIEAHDELEKFKDENGHHEKIVNHPEVVKLTAKHAKYAAEWNEKIVKSVKELVAGDGGDPKERAQKLVFAALAPFKPRNQKMLTPETAEAVKDIIVKHKDEVFDIITSNLFGYFYHEQEFAEFLRLFGYEDALVPLKKSHHILNELMRPFGGYKTVVGLIDSKKLYDSIVDGTWRKQISKLVVDLLPNLNLLEDYSVKQLFDFIEREKLDLSSLKSKKEEMLRSLLKSVKDHHTSGVMSARSSTIDRLINMLQQHVDWPELKAISKSLSRAKY